MIQTQDLTFSRSVAAPPGEVSRAFTHPTLLRDWLCDAAASEARPGGHLFLNWRFVNGPQGYSVAGTYQQITPEQVIFTWHGSGDPGPTTVTVICADEDGQTRASLVHSGLGEGPEWEALARRWAVEWPAALENLQSVLEKGVDLRQARRPRLGIWMDELSAEKAAELGAPGGQGVLLEETVEGSGAEAAGLQKDDVLVSLNGVALAGPESFGLALKGLQAGDRPEVVFYRAGERRAVALELGSSPTPEPPPSPAELADRVRANNAEMLESMRAKLSGLSEEAAARRPSGPDDWNALELAAHFILMERDYQSWVADMLNDQPVEDDLAMRPNVTPRLKALVERMPRIEPAGGQPGLLGELALAMEETAAMLAALPAALVERKHLYQRVAGWALVLAPSHYTGEHKDQFERVSGQ